MLFLLLTRNMAKEHEIGLTLRTSGAAPNPVDYQYIQGWILQLQLSSHTFCVFDYIYIYLIVPMGIPISHV